MSHTLLPPTGFLSYVRKDDELTGQRISRLCRMLRESLQLRVGQDVDIFQDTAKIPHGAVWEKRTLEAVGRASFFIPVVTPAYLRSKWCGKELREFRARENKLLKLYPSLSGASLIFPVHLTDVDDTDPDEQGLFDELQQLQLFDFRDMLYSDYDTPAVRGAISRFVADIRTLLRTPLVKTVPPAPRAPRPSRRPSPSSPSPSPSTLVPTPPPTSNDEREIEEMTAPPGPGGVPAQTDRTGLWFLGGLAAVVFVGALASLLNSRGASMPPVYFNNSAAENIAYDPCVDTANFSCRNVADNSAVDVNAMSNDMMLYDMNAPMPVDNAYDYATNAASGH